MMYLSTYKSVWTSIITGLVIHLLLAITKGYGVRAATIALFYAFAPYHSALRKFHVTDSQNTRDQITSDRRPKGA